MNKRVYIRLFCAMALLAGCNTGSDVTDSTTAALELKVGIGSMETRGVVVSGNTFDRESKIKVVVTDYDGGVSKYNDKANYIYKDQGGAGVWLPENSVLQLGTDNAMVSTHYPADLPSGADYNTTTKIFTPVLTTSLNFGDLLNGEYNADNSFWTSFKDGDPKFEIFMADGEIDYMQGKMTNAQAVTKDSKLAQIQMNHNLTMVIFNIFKADMNPAPCVVKSIKVKNVNSAKALCTGTFTIPDGTFTPSATAIEYVRTMDNFPNNSYFGMMMFPATIAANQVEIEFLVDDQIYALPIEACEWKAGYVNLYRVRLTPVKAELVDVVSVKDWGTGTDKEFEVN